VPLCHKCHEKVHDVPFGKNHSHLIRKGLQEAKLGGKQLGRPRNNNISSAMKFHNVGGLTIRQAAIVLGFSRSKTHRLLKKTAETINELQTDL
jgi:hypothetical protein